MDPVNNVIKVPPRRERVIHKGMHGWVEYHPGTKTWTYSFKYQVTFRHTGECTSKAEAALEVKRAIDIIAGEGTSVRSVD